MALLIRSGKARPQAAAGPAAGEIVTFFSPKGGVGTTTLAVNTAVLLGGGPPTGAGHGAGSCSSTSTCSSARSPPT